MNDTGVKTICHRCGFKRKCRVINTKSKHVHSKARNLLGSDAKKRINICNRCEKKGAK